MEEELNYLRTERQSLLAALGQKADERPWPAAGDLVRIAAEWDGISLFGEDTACLFLQQGDQVRVSFVSDEGWLWGTVAGTKQSGWFGGHGCIGVRKISVDVPLGPADPSSVPPETPPEEELTEFGTEVQEYVERHAIDERTQQALKELSADLQLQVIEADLVNCRNPSAVLLSRVRTIQSSRNSTPRLAGPGPPAVAFTAAVPGRDRSRSPLRGKAQNEEEVDEFIARHGLDEAAAQALKILPGHLQTEVMATDLGNCRNPSAVLMGRVRSLESGSSGKGSSWRGPPQEDSGEQEEVEAFIGHYELDDVASNALRALPLPAQMEVIQVELRNVRNPSAVVSSRIKEYHQAQRPPPGKGGGKGGGGGASRLSRAVEDYIRKYRLDGRVASDLRQLPPEAQDSVIGSDIVNARNPSAVVTKRIQEARAWSSSSSFRRR